MKQPLLFLFISIVVLTGCDKKNNTTVVTAFPQAGKLQAQVKQFPVPALLPRFMGVAGDKLVVYKEREEKMFALFGLPDCSYIGDMGNRGQGPDDFNILDSRSFYMHEDGFEVLEAGNNLLKTVSIRDNELKVLHSESIFQQGIANNGFYRLADSLYLTLGRLNEENEYCLFDRKTGEITSTDTYPNWVNIERNNNTPPPFVFYLKTCVAHPDGRKFAAFYARFKRLRIYDQQVRLLHDVDVRVAPYATNFEGGGQLWPGYYMGQPYVTDDHIYILCENSKPGASGRDYRCELQVWTWEGKPVACFEFDRKISLMAISRKFNKIYALDAQIEDEMYVYDLPEIK